MPREMLLGTVAGAAGTVALNTVTYADMAVRARPPSSVPAEVAGPLGELAGVDLSGGSSDEETVQNRKSALGALSGFAVGLGVGTAYGLVRPHLGDVSRPLAGTVLGIAAMAGSDVPATRLGVTDPSEWSLDSWVSDIVPHLAYGLITALAHDFLADV